MAFLAQYGLFLAKTITFVVAFLVVLVGVIAISSKGKASNRVKVSKLNDKFEDMAEAIHEVADSKKEFKEFSKAEKKAHKKDKAEKAAKRPRIFVLEFNGDIRAHAVENLREEVTAILTAATAKDQVLVRLESPGGVVPGYGLAASQLLRIKQKNIPLTIAVDIVAASGGYLMACVADKILAAPFAMIGSIGVIAQIPNFHRLLRKHDIDFEQVTAGEFKRTLTMFGENTKEAREKMKQDLQDIHLQFKDFIQQHRPHIDMGQVATGEVWLGNKAKSLKLIDELQTSDDYLLEHSENYNLYLVKYKRKKNLSQKFSQAVAHIMRSSIDSWTEESTRSSYY